MKLKIVFLLFVGAIFIGCTKPPEACFDFTSFDKYIFFDPNCSEDADSYEWDFGDGETSTQTYPTHQYDFAGTYEVRLLARNKKGERLIWKSVTVY
ncbi:MAG: PKD domain-containing protein [Salibacteraceae bacterium]